MAASLPPSEPHSRYFRVSLFLGTTFVLLTVLFFTFFIRVKEKPSDNEATEERIPLAVNSAAPALRLPLSYPWWDKPVSTDRCPPGLVACGEDDPRLGASLVYFKQGRALGKPWLWLCAPKTGHSIYPLAENFIRDYFSAILKSNGVVTSGEWVDIDHKSKAEQDVLKNQPSVTGWLPDPELLSQWQKVHQP